MSSLPPGGARRIHASIIRTAYRDARIAELRWAVVVQELKLKQREEQRRIQEQIREEEKARREYERAIQEAAKEEETICKAMEKAQAKAAHATAQQTRSGHVYVISNIGSFGEDVLKIGMMRRLYQVSESRN